MDEYTPLDDPKTLDDIDQSIDIGLQAVSANFDSSLSTIKFLLLILVVLGIIALVHFW